MIRLPGPTSLMRRVAPRRAPRSSRVRLPGVVLAALLGAVILAATDRAGAAEPYPARPLTLIVPFSAGGPTDRIAQALAPVMGEALGQTISVKHVAGTGGTIGTRALIDATAGPGYTLLLHHIGLSSAPTLYRRLGFDVLRDLAPVGHVAAAPMLLIGRPGLDSPPGPALADWLRASQNHLTLAYAGPGSSSQLCTLALQQALGASFFALPYKGTGPALRDLEAGRIDLMCDQTTTALPSADAGKARLLALASPVRLAMRSDLPTTGESGMRGLRISAWHGLYAQRDTPQPVLQALARALRRSVVDPGFVDAMQRVGVVPAAPASANPQALRHDLETEVNRWRPLIRAAGTYAD